MDLYIKDRDMIDIGIVENAESVVWKKHFTDAGKFEVYAGITDEYLRLLQRDHFVVRHDDDMVGVIERVEVSKDADGRFMLLASGRCAKSIFARRIIWKQQTYSGTAWNRMYWMIHNNVFNPGTAALNRQIGNITVADLPVAQRGPSREQQCTGDNLLDALKELCETANMGWKVTASGTNLVVHLLTGADRTLNQTDLEPVIFADDFDNLITSTVTMDSIGHTNVALIGGEGEGSDRIWEGVDLTGSASGSYHGLDRYELYVDARDLQRSTTNEKGEEIVMPPADYTKALQQRGLEKLLEHSNLYTMSGDVDIGAYRYRTDYDVGDLVSIKDAFGNQAQARIVAVEEIEDADGYTITPTFSDFTIINLA